MSSDVPRSRRLGQLRVLQAVLEYAVHRVGRQDGIAVGYAVRALREAIFVAFFYFLIS